MKRGILQKNLFANTRPQTKAAQGTAPGENKPQFRFQYFARFDKTKRFSETCANVPLVQARLPHEGCGDEQSSQVEAVKQVSEERFQWQHEYTASQTEQRQLQTRLRVWPEGRVSSLDQRKFHTLSDVRQI